MFIYFSLNCNWDISNDIESNENKFVLSVVFYL